MNIDELLPEEQTSREVISETDKTIIFIEDGEKKAECKLCGDIVPYPKMASHFTKNHRKKKNKKPKPRQESQRPKIEPESNALLTPEDEELEEMVETLRSQMEATPGMGNKPEKVNWFVEQYFRNVKKIREDPTQLYNALQRHFPKVEEDAISLIVNSVFEIKQQYERPRSLFQHRGYEPPVMMNPSTPPPSFMGTTSDPTQALLGIIYEMWRDMRSTNQTPQPTNPGGLSPDDVKALVEAEVEKRHLREEVERLQETVNRLIENQGKTPPSVEGWTDDYARLLSVLGTQFLNLGQNILVEQKKNRRMLIKYLAPSIIKSDNGRVPEGETDDEIIEKLEEQGLVEQ